MAKKVNIRFFLILLVFLFLAIGIYMGEFYEIYRNSVILCLSCIGIQ